MQNTNDQIFLSFERANLDYGYIFFSLLSSRPIYNKINLPKRIQDGVMHFINQSE